MIDLNKDEAEIKFKILSQEEYGAETYGSESMLTSLGGCTDNGEELGLGEWTYQFEVEVQNKEGEIKQFTIAFQPEERYDGLRNYSGCEIARASLYGYDSDESQELECFCDYDCTVLDALYDIAQKAAKTHYKDLISHD